MQITLNGESVVLAESRLTLEELLRRFPPNHRGFAVEVNGVVVPRREHEQAIIHEGDRVEVVTLVGGG